MFAVLLVVVATCSACLCLYKYMHTQPSIRTVIEWQWWAAGFCEGVNGRSLDGCQIIPKLRQVWVSRVSVKREMQLSRSTQIVLVNVHVCVRAFFRLPKSTHFCPSLCECKMQCPPQHSSQGIHQPKPKVVVLVLWSIYTSISKRTHS